MKLSLDPALTAPRHVTAESEALADWYDAHPQIRRLWAIRDGEALGVVVTIEPTVDNGDTGPTWFACNHQWVHEIQSIAGCEVRLGLLEEPLDGEFEVDLDGEIVASISWRDPTWFWKAPSEI